LELNGALQGLFTYTALAGNEEGSMDEMVKSFPFVERLLEAPYSLPPPPPVLTPASFVQAITNYLRDSRKFRQKFPTYDRATKANQKHPTRSSTYVKFSLGVSTKGCTHYGAGRVIGSSVPDALEYVDWMQGKEAFNHEPKSNFIVSDMAIKDEDGLGCGTYPGLVTKVKDWYASGKQVLVKLNIFDFLDLEKDIPISILFKPRKHNLEVICAVNIPCVGLDEYEVLEGVISENIRRNEIIYAQKLPQEAFERVDVECLADDKDYDAMIAGMYFGDLPIYAEERDEKVFFSPQDLELSISMGMCTWEDIIDARAVVSVRKVLSEFRARKPVRPPKYIRAAYAEWDQKYKEKRLIPHWMVDDTGIFEIPLATLCAHFNHYSLEKLTYLYHIIALQNIGKVVFRQSGITRTTEQIRDEYAHRN